MSGTTLLAVIVGTLAIIAFLAGILIATADEHKSPRSRFRRFVTHPVTVATSAALAVGCLTGVVVLGILTIAPSVTASSSVPKLAASYNGSIHNATFNMTADMSLTSIQQSGGTISGNFQVSAPLAGSGNFTGTVDPQRHVTFTVTSHLNGSTIEIDFTGIAATNGGMSGAYTVHSQDGNPDQHGTWTVTPNAG